MIAVRRVGSLIPPVLRTNADFRKAFLGSLSSALGSAMSTIAYPMLVLALGGSAVKAGSVVTISLSTRMILRLPAGSLVDRWSHRTVMLSTDVIRMLVLGSVALAIVGGWLHYPQLVAAAVAEGAATALFGSASNVLTKDVVSEEHLTGALGLGQSVLAATYLAGPAFGGALFALGHALPFAADASSYAVSAYLIWRITTRPGPRTEAEHRDNGVTAGIRWLVRERALFTILLYASVINLVSAAIEVLIIIDLRAHGVSSGTTGLILSCSGVGAVAGSLASGFVVRKLPTAAILLGLGAIWSVILAVFYLAFSPDLAAVLLLTLMTLSPAAGVIVGHTLLSRTPRDLLGRVGAATSILLSGLAALGPLLAGALFQALGPAHAWLCLAVLTALSALVGGPSLLNAELPRVPGVRETRDRDQADLDDVVLAEDRSAPVGDHG